MAKNTNRIGTLALLIGLALAGCKKSGAADAGRPPLPEGIAALPVETRVVVGVNVKRLGSSPLVTRLLDWVLAGDPALEKDATSLLARCGIAPRRDVEQVLVGMGADRSEVGLVVTGSFNELALLVCLRQAMADVGGRLETKSLAGRNVYLLVNPSAGTSTWVATGGGRVLLVAFGEEWLRRMIDPAAAKLPTSAATMALVRRVDAQASIWGAGTLRPEAGRRIAEATQGVVKEPAVSLTGELRLGEGAAGVLQLDLATEADATALVDFARTQHALLALGAQKYGLGRVVGKLSLTSEGKVVRMSIDLDAGDVVRLGEALDKLKQ